MSKKVSSRTRSLFLFLPTVLSQIIALPGILGFGGGLAVSTSGQAAAAVVNQCNTQDEEFNEKCACEAALKENTIEALEEFLRKYPVRHSSACSALALNALKGWAGDEKNSGPPDDPGDGDYGT